MTDKPCSEIAKEISGKHFLPTNITHEIESALQTERTAREKAEAEVERLKADRHAFAEETQQYRDHWLNDQKALTSLRSTIKEKDAEIGRLKMELAESKDSHTAKQRLRLCDKINKLESQLQAQAEVNKAVSGLLRKIEVCSYIDEILEEVDVVHNALTRLEAEG